MLDELKYCDREQYVTFDRLKIGLPEGNAGNKTTTCREIQMNWVAIRLIPNSLFRINSYLSALSSFH